MQTKQCTEAPNGGDTKGDDEGHAEQASRESILAPSLEHGHHSNHKKHNRKNTYSFQPHMETFAELRPPAKQRFNEALLKDRLQPVLKNVM